MEQGIQRQSHPLTSSKMALALDHFSRRWALRIVWELRTEALTFRRLQAACGGISPSVLQRRLHELKALGVVERIPLLGYRLTVHGQRLFPLLVRLEGWSVGLELPESNENTD